MTGAGLRVQGDAFALACAMFALACGLVSPARSAEAPAGPRETEISYYYDLVDQTLFRPVSRTLDPVIGIRRLTGSKREAVNVDAQGAIRLPSTWWQPRLGFRPVTVDQLLHGPGPSTGQAPGPWTVTRAKTQGVTPGFFIKDAAGQRFIIKFDPRKQPEMATGADVVSSYLLWGAGFNVPDNVIVHFRREDLRFESGAQYTDVIGRKRPISDEFLDKLLARVPQREDGSYRAVASRLLSGRPLGPFEYRGRRRDDPEDLIPHQHRRELRGFWTLCAWLSHADSRGPNSLDMWVTEGGRSFVRHHLIDFGSCLGSGAVAARSPQTGSEYFVDYGVMTRALLTLGLHRPAWEASVDPGLPSIGFIEGDTFDPDSWRPDYPNPAFDERTRADIEWGARIVAGFSDAHIRAAVEQGKFSNPRATDYLTKVLIKRRDKIVRQWLGGQAGATP
ncbi:MAG: hypothetical protein HOP12_04370 [Candidatus Eisenbacteria bacterium]|uniref:HipA domain-containing protein n=1 Tax=Eiseniibacteriota bacterium TaxID=2212470 RepID=A0A849SCG2_UNCEI|nr:hypothetical protein [Candidatus Eisenbacteria bacterium]